MTLDPRLLAILACPADKGPLHYVISVAASGGHDDEVLYNPRLRLVYAVQDGIPVMLVDEARTAGDDEHELLTARIRDEQIPPTFRA